MKTDTPHQKSFAYAGVMLAIIGGIAIVNLAQNLLGFSSHTVFVITYCLLSALAAGLWGFYSRKTWSWGRFTGAVVVFYLAFGLMMFHGLFQR